MNTTNISGKAEAEVVADIVRKAGEVVTLDVRAGQVLAVPQNVSIQSIKEHLDEYLTAPERKKGTARLSDLTSFIDHAKRFADEDSALFADPDADAPVLVSVLDYHRRTATGAPRFGEHRGIYDFPLSDEWEAWTDKNGSAATMSQDKFAEFIENRILDIAPGGEADGVLAETLGATLAGPSRLLELSRGLTVRTGSRVQNAKNLSTGEVQFQYEVQHQDESGAPLKVPAAFAIAIPVFKNGALYRLAVRLRYRVNAGTVSWFYELYRHEAAFTDAFREACEKARKETGLPLYFGKSE